MQYRKLGRTGLLIGEIGLGGEYLHGLPREVVVGILNTALERGVNYFDIVFAFPEFRDNLAAVLRSHRDSVVMPAHLGSSYREGQYRRTRTIKECERLFLDQLVRFETDHVDVLLLHNVNGIAEWEELLQPKGLMELAQRYKQGGQARCIGMSGHDAPSALRAARSGLVDVLMFPTNMAAHALPGRKDLFMACANLEVGIVGMKPFAGGKLFHQRQTVYIAGYETGGRGVKRKIAPAIGPVQCVSYALAQPSVATVVPGIKSSTELEAVLAYVDAPDSERDYAEALASFQDYVSHECVYCNHCLPCPEHIDIGRVGQLVDLAESGALAAAQEAYRALAVPASACTECRACVPRCPFAVDITGMMRRAAEVFSA